VDRLDARRQGVWRIASKAEVRAFVLRRGPPLDEPPRKHWVKVLIPPTRRGFGCGMLRWLETKSSRPASFIWADTDTEGS